MLTIIRCFIIFLAMVSFAYGGENIRRTPVVAAVEKVGQSVVNIRTEQIIRRDNRLFGFNDPFFEDFFKGLMEPEVYRTQSLGSGFVVDASGIVLTNSHVIDKASKIFVAFPKAKQELEAELVGRTGYLDLAVLKIKGKGPFVALSLGGSSDLMLGETVIAIGNPLGLGHSITTGVVSAVNRRVPVQEKIFSIFIQTDALINPGNSGGPLINIKGEVIGINTAIIKQAQGIGFAVPADAVKRVLPDLLERGGLRKPYHGILPGRVGSEFSGKGGVLVSGVDEDSPAAEVGLLYGDVIVAMDGIALGSPPEMQALLSGYIPGNIVALTVERGFESLEKRMQLQQFPENYGFVYGRKMYGLEVHEAPRGVAIKKVTEKSPAAEKGLHKGDLIMEIGDHPVENISDFQKIMLTHIGFEPQRFLVVRSQRGYYVDLP